MFRFGEFDDSIVKLMLVEVVGSMLEACGGSGGEVV